MKPNLRSFDRMVRVVLAALLLFAAVELFDQPIARVVAGIVALFSLLEAATGMCWLYARLGVKSPKDALKPEALFLLGVLGVQGVLAYEWWSAGWEKISNLSFVAGIEKTLELFASKNPFPWYVSFLRDAVLPNAAAFAYAVEWSQIAIAVALAGSIFAYLYSKDQKVRNFAAYASVLALAGGAIMNANFYLAAAWTSAATRGSNVVMFWTELVLLFVWLSLLVGRKR